MFDKSALEEFELMTINTGVRTHNRITIESSGGKMHISSKYIDELGWKSGDRFDLRKKGTTFALVPNKVGLVKGKCLNPKSNTMTICSTDMCLKIRAATSGCRVFEGWVEEDVLFFRPVKGDK